MSNIDVQWPFFGYIYFATNNYYGYSVLVSTLHVNLNGLDDQNKSKLKIYNEFSAKLATLAASFGSSILTFLFMGSMSPYYFKTIFRQCIKQCTKFHQNWWCGFWEKWQQRTKICSFIYRIRSVCFFWEISCWLGNFVSWRVPQLSVGQSQRKFHAITEKYIIGYNAFEANHYNNIACCARTARK